MNEGVGTTHQDGELPPGGDIGDDVSSAVAEVGGGELTGGGVDVAEEVVGDAAALGEGDLVGGDVEASVDLHFVGVEDFGEREEEGGKVDGKAGFSGAGGSHDDDDLVFAAVVVEGGGVHARPTELGAGGGRGRGEKGDGVG